VVFSGYFGFFHQSDTTLINQNLTTENKRPKYQENKTQNEKHKIGWQETKWYLNSLQSEISSMIIISSKSGQVGGFLQILRFPQTNKTDRHDISGILIVESGV
jgi:hypothetical protein